MTSLSQLKREIENLKAKQGISDEMLGFDILDKYLDGKLSYDEAMELLDTNNYQFDGLVRVLLASSRYDDETKKEMQKYK